MEKHVLIKDEHNALTSADKEIIRRDAASILERYRFTEAHFSIHIKTTEQKHLTHVKINLVTDRGNYNSSEEGYNLYEVCETCLLSLRTQLEKNAERSYLTA